MRDLPEGYHGSPRDGWYYRGLRVQAHLETHIEAGRCALRESSPGSRALDLATGTGAFARFLADQGFSVSVSAWNDACELDYTKYSLNLDLPFSLVDVGGQEYDMVSALEIIEHVENPSQLIRSIASVLRPGGTAIVSTPIIASVAARLQWLLRGEPRAFRMAAIRENRHISMLWDGAIDVFCEQAGLSVEESKSVGRERPGTGVRASLRSVIVRAITPLFPDAASAESRLYVLRRTSTLVRRLGPDQVY